MSFNSAPPLRDWYRLPFLTRQDLASLNSGTVTSITAGTGLSGGTITSTGTISLNANLNNLNNVQEFFPIVDNQVLTWTTLAGWHNSTIYLNSLFDVTTTSPTLGQFLRYDGTRWVNQTVALGGGTVTSVTAGTGLSGGTITSTGTIALNANLDDLNDVNRIFPLVDNQVLVFTTLNGWHNSTIYLSSLFDVTTTSPTLGQFLRYDGTRWVNQTVALGGGTVTSVTAGAGLAGGTITTTGTISLNASLFDLNNVTFSFPLMNNQVLLYTTLNGWHNSNLNFSDLSGVSITSPTTGQVLQFNGTNWVNQTVALGGGTVTSITAGTGLSGGTITSTGTISLNAGLTNLTDVAFVTALQDFQVLMYDAGNAQWRNSRLHLHQLEDATILFPTAGQFLVYNGTQWANTSVSFGSGTVTSITAGTGLSGGTITSTGTIALNATLNDLTDTTISSPSSGQYLRFNGSQWINQTVTSNDPFANAVTYANTAYTGAQTGRADDWITMGTRYDRGTVGSPINNPRQNLGLPVEMDPHMQTVDNDGFSIRTDDWLFVYNPIDASIGARREISWQSIHQVDKTRWYTVDTAKHANVGVPTKTNMPLLGCIPILEAYRSESPQIPGAGTDAPPGNLQSERIPFNDSYQKWKYRLTLRNLDDMIKAAVGTQSSTDPGKFFASEPAEVAPIIFPGITNSTIPGTGIITSSARQVLRYNGTAWVNEYLYLDSLEDVVITSPTLDQFLRYDGTNWVNQTVTLNSGTVTSITAGTGLSGGTITSTGTISLNAGLDDLTDVVVASPTLDQFLRYDGTNWVNQTVTLNSGTVTSITAGTGLSGGTITSAGTIALNAGLDDLTDVVLTSVTAGQFLAHNGTNWFNLTPVLYLADGQDVQIVSPTAGQFLRYNGTKWENHTTVIDDLSDVVITSPALNQFLRYDGTNWINQTVTLNSGTVTSITAGTGLSGGTITSTGTIALNAGLDDLTDVVLTSVTAGQFLAHNGTNWFNLTPVLYLADGQDVQIVSPTAGQFLRYNGTKWENHTTVIDDLSDVVITSPATNQFLRYNGTNWVNQTVTLNSGTVTSITAGTGLSGGTITSTGTIALNAGLDDLTDVVITSPSTFQFLLYNGTNWVNQLNPYRFLQALADVNVNVTPVGTPVLRWNGSTWSESTLNLDSLTDVVITSPQANQFISYNGTNFVNVFAGTNTILNRSVWQCSGWNGTALNCSTAGINDTTNTRLDNGMTPLPLELYANIDTLSNVVISAQPFYTNYTGTGTNITDSDVFPKMASTVTIQLTGAGQSLRSIGAALNIHAECSWTGNNGGGNQVTRGFLFYRIDTAIPTLSGTGFTTFPYELPTWSPGTTGGNTTYFGRGMMTRITGNASPAYSFLTDTIFFAEGQDSAVVGTKTPCQYLTIGLCTQFDNGQALSTNNARRAQIGQPAAAQLPYSTSTYWHKTATTVGSRFNWGEGADTTPVGYNPVKVVLTWMKLY